MGKEESESKKTGFWQRAALRSTIVLAGLGVGQRAAAQENIAQDQEPAKTEIAAENMGQAVLDGDFSREDVAEFKMSVLEAQREYQADRIDMAEDILDDAQYLKEAYGKPSREDFDSRKEYREAVKDWKAERRKPSKKDFGSAEEYHDALSEWKSDKEGRIIDKMDVLVQMQGQEAHEALGPLAAQTGDMVANAMEISLDHAEKLAEMTPGTKEFKKETREWKKDLKKNAGATRLKAEAQALKGKEGSSQALQKFGRYLNNEKALDAALAKGVKQSRKIIKQAEKETKKLDVRTAKLNGSDGR